MNLGTITVTKPTNKSQTHTFRARIRSASTRRSKGWGFSWGWRWRRVTVWDALGRRRDSDPWKIWTRRRRRRPEYPREGAGYGRVKVPRKSTTKAWERKRKLSVTRLLASNDVWAKDFHGGIQRNLGLVTVIVPGFVACFRCGGWWVFLRLSLFRFVVLYFWIDLVLWVFRIWWFCWVWENGGFEIFNFWILISGFVFLDLGLYS